MSPARVKSAEQDVAPPPPDGGPTAAEMLEFAADPIFFIDPAGIVLEANRKGLEALGEDAIGGNLGDRVEGGAEALNRIFSRAARTSATLPCSLVLHSDRGPERYKAECRRFGRDGRAAYFGFRLRVREANRFTALKQKIADLNREVRERRRLQLQLEQSLEANERLLKELQHRVKNNIQVLTVLLGQQASRSGNAEFMDLVETARQRLLAISRAHEFMYRTGQFAYVPAAAFIGSVVELLEEGFTGDVEVGLELNAEWQVPHERANTLALIINELVVNAYKHGWTGDKCRIDVRLERESDCHLLTVRDYGKGFPDDIDTASSLGLVLVRGLCNDLKGRLEMVNENGAVTRIRIPAEPKS